MKRTVGIMALALAILVAVAAIASAAAPGGIGQTKHNLSITGTGSVHLDPGVANQTTEICVFCHTPHGGRTNDPASPLAPLWNRQINETVNAYTPYRSITLDATPGQPTGASLACLSCHDGTIAFDALLNQPGSGAIISGTANSALWTFVGAGAGNKMPDGITKLGVDLRNTHPISVKYADAKSPSSSNGTNDHSTGFNDPAACDLNDTAKDCYFGTGVKVTGGYVQCTSCHDPHRNAVTFLRTGTNDGSQLCLTCHKKDS